MEKIKQLNTLIDQTCSDKHNQPPVMLYTEILNLIESRVDLPKHSIAAIAKKLTHKSKKVLFIAFDLLEYLSYNLELPFFSQIATKQFLFKISGLLLNKDTEPLMIDKILKLVKCLDQLFRPLEDFLPLFFQFEAGLLRKQYQIPYEYISPYRPKELKQYKKPQKAEEKKKKPVVEPTKDEQKKFEQIRQKILLVNEIMSNCDPSEEIKKNDLVIELIEQLRQSQKVINSTIDENPTELIMELALATNDDLVTTYRRFKDLQRNRKPEVFILAELASDALKEEPKPVKKQEVKKSQTKIQSKPEPQKFQSIFQAFDTSIKKQMPQPQPELKPANQNIFDLLGGDEEKQSEATQASKIMNVTELMDISPAQTIPQNNGMNLDFLGGGGSSSNQQNDLNTIMSQMLSMNLGMGQPSQFGLQQNQSQPIYQSMQVPIYGQSGQVPMYQSGYQSQIGNQGMGQDFLMSPMQGQVPSVYQNVSLNLNESPKKEEKEVDPIKNLTDLSGDFKF